MPEFKNLADALGLDADPLPPPSESSVADILDTSDPVAFCQKIVSSREFRQYIFNGISLGDLPAAVVCRVIDHAWGKPVDRIEHTGKDGRPIESVTEVRRIVIRAEAPLDLDEEEPVPVPYTRH